MQKLVKKYIAVAKENSHKEALASLVAGQQVTIDKGFNQTLTYLKDRYSEIADAHNPRTDVVDINNPKDDGWLEYRQAQILARKNTLKNVMILQEIADKTPELRDRIRAINLENIIALGKEGAEEIAARVNINILVQALTGNGGITGC